METLTETTAAATVRVEAGVSALACLSGHGSQEFWGQLVDLAWLHNLRILNSHSRNQLPLSPCIVYIHLSMKGHFFLKKRSDFFFPIKYALLSELFFFYFQFFIGCKMIGTLLC